MIENPYPKNWRNLQKGVCKIFNEIGLRAEESKVVSTPRGCVELDVYAVDNNSVDKIIYVVECKNWTSAIPKSVVHSFTTVMHEVGANVGYIISQKGLQTGTKEYIKNTNISGITYEEFQRKYFPVWYQKCFVPQIGDTVDELVQYVEPFNSRTIRAVNELSKPDRQRYFDLVRKYRLFGMIMAFFEVPNFSSRFILPAPEEIEEIKKKIVEASGKEFEFTAIYFRDLLNEIRSKIREVTEKFHKVFGENIFA